MYSSNVHGIFVVKDYSVVYQNTLKPDWIMSFNGQRVLTEIIFSRIDQHNKIDLKVKCHAGYIDITGIENKTVDMSIMEKSLFHDFIAFQITVVHGIGR